MTTSPRDVFKLHAHQKPQCPPQQPPPKKQNFRKPADRQQTSAPKRPIFCYRCDGNHQADACRFKTAVCRLCNKTGHIQRACWTKPNSVSEVRHIERVDLLDSPGRLRQTCLLKNKTVTFNVDTGTGDSFISIKTWKKLRKPRLTPVTKTYRCAANNSLPVIGEISIPTSVMNPDVSSPILQHFVVTKANHHILGRTAIKQLGLSIDKLLCDTATPAQQKTGPTPAQQKTGPTPALQKTGSTPALLKTSSTPDQRMEPQTRSMPDGLEDNNAQSVPATPAAPETCSLPEQPGCIQKNSTPEPERNQEARVRTGYLRDPMTRSTPRSQLHLHSKASWSQRRDQHPARRHGTTTVPNFSPARTISIGSPCYVRAKWQHGWVPAVVTAPVAHDMFRVRLLPTGQHVRRHVAQLQQRPVSYSTGTGK